MYLVVILVGADVRRILDTSKERKSRAIFTDGGYLKKPQNFLYLFFTLAPVANVSFETTEEQLRAVLSEVGPVVSLK